MGPTLRRIVFVFAAVIAVGWTSLSSACPFCSEERGPTLVGSFMQANMVLLGTFQKAQLKGVDEGTTEFQIEEVLKSHELVDKKPKTITIPRYINQPGAKYLIFCDVYKNTVDPLQGIEVGSDSELVKYLKGAIALKDAPQPKRLRYAFDFLNSSEVDVALDAYREYAKADYSDYKEMAKSLPADTLAKWLLDEKTPPYRYGLYASLLGHCGKKEHAQLLRKMIDDPTKRMGSGLDGMLASYVMLEPKEAWDYLQGVLKDQKQEFLVRYAVLRTIRFLWDQRPDLIAKNDLVKGTALVLDHADMADFGVEDLRRWQRWEMTDRILDLLNLKSHDVPVIKRAVLRYALRNPEERAKKYVAEMRRVDMQYVQDTEALLEADSPPPVKTEEKKK